MKLTSLLDIAYSRLFGYDIFISYTRADAKDYAAKLHEQLTSLDYSCFIDRKDAPSGRSLNSSLISALKGSKTLVVIATARALEREYVQLEFGKFAASLRPIIPINVESALTGDRLKENPWGVIKERDLIWIDETGDSLKSGLPSPEVYEGIQNLFKFTRRNVARRRWATLAALLILSVAMIAIWQAKEAKAQKRDADEQRGIVEKQTAQLLTNRGDLQRSNDDLKEQQKALEERNTELQTNKKLLESKTKEAIASVKKAQEQETLAHDNARKAEEQQKIAETQQKIADAQLVRNQHLLYDSEMSLAYSAYENTNFTRVEELLNSHFPSEEKPRKDDLRGFEWYHLWHLRPKEPLSLPKHSEDPYEITSVAFSPDGETLASAGGTTVGLWSISTKEDQKPLAVPSANAVAFSPDGKILATLSDETIQIWDAHTLNPEKTFKVPHNERATLAFSPDNKTLAFAASYLDIVMLWDTSSWQELKSLQSPGGSVAFSPGGKILAVGSNKGVRLWDTSTWKEMMPPLEVESSYSLSPVAFSPEGNMLATVDHENVVLWNSSTWKKKELEPLKGHGGFILSVAFSPDGRTLASGSADGTAKLWDTSTGKEVTTLKGDGYVRSVAFSPDGKVLSTGTKLWDISWRQDQLPLLHSDNVLSVAFSPDGRTLATGSNDSLLKLWDTTTRRELKTLTEHTKRIWSVAFSPDGKTLATGSEDKTVKLWNTSTWQERKLQLSEEVTFVAFSLDGKVLAVCSKYESLRLWDPTTGKELPGLKGDSKYTKFVAFSPDGKLITAGNSVRIWDLNTRLPLAVVADLGSGPMALSPDGKMLALATFQSDGKGEGGGEITLWDLTTPRQLGVLKGHTSVISSLAFSPDGRTLVTGGYDYAVKFWNPDTQQELATLKVGSIVESVAFSQGGKMLAIGVSDHTARLWYSAVGSEIEDQTKQMGIENRRERGGSTP